MLLVDAFRQVSLYINYHMYAYTHISGFSRPQKGLGYFMQYRPVMSKFWYSNKDIYSAKTVGGTPSKILVLLVQAIHPWNEKKKPGSFIRAQLLIYGM